MRAAGGASGGRGSAFGIHRRVDYTLAPFAKYNHLSNEVIAAIGALLKEGQRLDYLAIYGDSSGGGLAAAVVLKTRDRGLGMPAAAVLVSPWLDITPSGDSETTLHDSDPNALYEKHGTHEGMIHNFQDRIPDAPEAILARQKMRIFLHQHLGVGAKRSYAKQ